MDILIIGSGGREHALCYAVAKSTLAEKIYCAPGNAGTAEFAENINIKAEDIDALSEFAEKNKIGLTVVGPEAPLVGGIVDIFESKGLKIFGPNADAARMEGSKVFTKSLFKKNNIPTGDFAAFDDSAEAAEYIKKADKFPVVVKADGLAAGKGVIICKNKEEALGAVNEIMDKQIFGGAGDRIIIEEFLEGEETSILAFTDGSSILALPASQDHKRIHDNDEGPNTGGMGAYAPAPLVTPEMTADIMMNILEPTLSGLKREGIVYKGILYAGIIVTKDGPKVLEYNVRFGDPETQAVLPLLKSDIVDLFLACVDGNLHEKKIEIYDGAAICVVQAAPGYPGEYKKGMEITGLDSFEGRDDLLVFQAGTKKDAGKTAASGGRVLALTALDRDIESAIKKVYENIESIKFEGAYYRKDIGAKALKK